MGMGGATPTSTTTMGAGGTLPACPTAQAAPTDGAAGSPARAARLERLEAELAGAKDDSTRRSILERHVRTLRVGADEQRDFFAAYVDSLSPEGRAKLDAYFEIATASPEERAAFDRFIQGSQQAKLVEYLRAVEAGQRSSGGGSGNGGAGAPGGGGGAPTPTGAFDFAAIRRAQLAYRDQHKVRPSTPTSTPMVPAFLQAPEPEPASPFSPLFPLDQ